MIFAYIDNIYMYIGVFANKGNMSVSKKGCIFANFGNMSVAK